MATKTSIAFSVQVADPAAVSTNLALTDFVWPAFFKENVVGSIDMSIYVPGYVDGATNLSVQPVNSVGQTDATPLPSNIIFDGRNLRYDGTAKQHPWAWGAYRLVATNPTFTSNKFNVVVGPEPTWLDGNGPTYDLGTNNGSFSTLQGLIDSIPSTGGWAQIPNTSAYLNASFIGGQYLRDYWLTRMSQGWSLKGNGAPGVIYAVWGTAVFNGRSLVMGAVGGHYTGWSNWMYRMRLTDPPGVVLMHVGFCAGAGANRGDWQSEAAWLAAGRPVTPTPGNPGGSVNWKPPYVWPHTPAWDAPENWERGSPVWGPGATHQYYGMALAANGKIIMGGSNQWYVVNDNTNVSGCYGMLWEIDVNAATPRDSFKPLRVEHLRVAPRAPFGVDTMMSLADGDVGAVDWNGQKWRYRSVQRDVVLDPSLSLTRTNPVGGELLMGGVRNPYSNKLYGISKSGGAIKLFCFDTGQQLTIPNYMSNQGFTVDNQGGVAFPNANTAVLFSGTPDSAQKAAKLDLTTGALTEFAHGSAPVGDYTGMFGRWQAIPEIQGFVALTVFEQNARVFRPPASWGLTWG